MHVYVEKGGVHMCFWVCDKDVEEVQSCTRETEAWFADSDHFLLASAPSVCCRVNYLHKERWTTCLPLYKIEATISTIQALAYC